MLPTIVLSTVLSIHLQCQLVSCRTSEKQNGGKSCHVDLDRLSDPPDFPFLVPTGKSTTAEDSVSSFLRPIRKGGKRLLELKKGERVIAGCPGKRNSLLATGTGTAEV